MKASTPRMVLVLALFLVSTGLFARTISVRSPALDEGDTWTVIEIDADKLPVFEAGWERRTFWDLRPARDAGRVVRWTVLRPGQARLASAAARAGADRAACAVEESSGQELDCRLFKASEIGPTGPRAHKSGSRRAAGALLEFRPGLERDGVVSAGDVYSDLLLADGLVIEEVQGQAVAEGLALVPAGPREVVLLREKVIRGSEQRWVYRFLSKSGEPVALFEGVVVEPSGVFVPGYGEVLTSISTRADDGLQIAYQDLSDALQAKTTGFLQYSVEFDPCFITADCTQGVCIGATTDPGGCQSPLSDFESSWTTVGAMISIDQTSVSYQPDPGDPSSQQTLAEVWDLSNLNTAELMNRTFNTTRDDTGWSSCLESCASGDVVAPFPDGTWQSYLKIDHYTPAGAQLSRDIFELNDNDTDGNPSIDVPFVAQDELNVSDRTQICFEDSGGAASERLLRFFQFTGASPAVATMSVGDTWTTGNWTSCNDGSGLHLTLASACDDACYPACPGGIASPRARGLLGGGVGISSEIVEDGFILMPTGNYVQSLLMAQITDIEAGRDFFASCVLSPQRNRAIDYFWLHEKYGLLATVSSPNDDGTCGTSLTTTDWSCVGNRTDGVDFTWGPFPPYQTEAQACLNGTRIEWSLPADGSNLSGEPGITDYGYVVGWGSATDPDDLADFATNPNHSPLPGAGGYLAAPVGSEPTSYLITGWPGASINATVVTTLRYTDPDAADTTTYQSAAFYKVVEDPAKLDPMTFQIGVVDPFAETSGNDIVLTWPAVSGASSYLVKVYDLATKLEIACPATMDCTVTNPTATHVDAWSSSTNFGYRAFAIDPCGAPSTN